MPVNSISLHRVIKASPDKVYRAFADPIAFSSWIPPYGFLGVIHHREFKAGGTYKMSFINFTTGRSQSFGGKMVELKPDRFIKYNDKFDDPDLPGEMTTSVWLTEVSVGTELKIIQEGIPTAIPLEMCYLGWQESLEKLVKLVEPEIPD